MNREFIPYDQSLELKELGFDEECLAVYVFSDLTFKKSLGTNQNMSDDFTRAPLYQQALSWIYAKSNGQINITINGSDTTEERSIKISKGIKDLWDLQGNKSK